MNCEQLSIQNLQLPISAEQERLKVRDFFGAMRELQRKRMPAYAAIISLHLVPNARNPMYLPLECKRVLARGWLLKLKSEWVRLNTHNACFINVEPFVNQPNQHADLIASYRKLEAEAKEKLELAIAAASKGPSAAKACNETAAKAKRRRDVAAAKLAKHGIDLP